MKEKCCKCGIREIVITGKMRGYNWCIFADRCKNGEYFIEKIK